MKKTILRMSLMTLALLLAFSQIALAEPPDILKAAYDALVDGWEIRNAEGTSAEYGDGFLKAALEEDAIIITETLEDGKSLSWTFVQEGNWATAPLGSDEDEGRSIAYMLLNKVAAAQGVTTDLFIGYINALPELQDNYRTIGEREGEKTISINIAGPYEYDLEAMDALAISEEYLLKEGWNPLGEDYKLIDLNYGKVKAMGVANANGMELTISEYGELDDLALQAIVSFVKVLQPKGWEAFVSGYTELKNMEQAEFSAGVNLDEAGLENAWMNYKEGYSFAHFTIGHMDDEETEKNIDYGTSELYTPKELEEAAVQVKCRFASFAGCELHSLRYAGDECNTEENLAWMNQLDEGKDYIQVAEFISDFHSPLQPGEDEAWEPDREYTGWEWWLARSADGGWQLLTWGYR